MSAKDDQSGQQSRSEQEETQYELDEDEGFDPAEYNTLILLERLESLEEEMTELGLFSLDDIHKRIEELNAQLDEERKS